jgi:uncharacterized protein YgiB involved in biofilm formation
VKSAHKRIAEFLLVTGERAPWRRARPRLVHNTQPPPMRTRRAPASITLVLIGSAALSGCGDETARRDIYRSSLDCRQDWGDVSECAPVHSGPHTGYYYGPSYRDERRNSAGVTTGPRQGSSAIGTAHLARNDTRHTSSPASSTHGAGSANTSRGGFGSTASSHSSGG